MKREKSQREVVFNRTVGLAHACTVIWIILFIACSFLFINEGDSVSRAVLVVDIGFIVGVIAAAVHRRLAWVCFDRWVRSCHVRHNPFFASLKPWHGGLRMK